MCGLFGIINKRPKRFDKRAFYTLGINNDSRGGDACGVFIDGKLEYGVSDKKLFVDYFRSSEMLKNIDKCRVAIGHCRKASIGGVGSDLAQPCVIKDENDNIVFVVTHNGTIRNYAELAKKYIPEIDINGMSDSQVMTNIFYYKGYDVLLDYQGTGAFVIADYREQYPRVFFYRGESKQYKYSVNVSEERPLYLIQTSSSMIYSSIPTYLLSLFPDVKLQCLVPNVLAEYTDEGLICVETYDRSNCFQNVVEQTSSVVKYGQYGGNWEDEDDYYYRGSYSKNTKRTGAEGFTTKTSSRLHMGSDFVVFDGKSNRADGEIIVDAFGNIFDSIKVDTDVIYCFNGVALKNESCYKFLDKLSKAWNLSHKEVTDIIPEIVWLLSPYPYKNFESTGTYLSYKINETNPYDLETYTGDVQLLFSAEVISLENGIMNYSKKRYANIDDCLKVINYDLDYKIPNKIITEYLNDFV